nr:organomercurial lyase [Corynebacterium sp. TAE3-ERU12]
MARGEGGTTVDPTDFGADATTIRNFPCTEWDGDRVAGSLISTNPTDHAISHADGQAWTWCIFDAMLAGLILDGPLELASTCPATGEPVRFTIADGRISGFRDSDLVTLPAAFLPGNDLRADFCCRTRMWAEAGPAERVVWLGVEEAFDVVQEVAARLRIV